MPQVTFACQFQQLTFSMASTTRISWCRLLPFFAAGVVIGYGNVLPLLTSRVIRFRAPSAAATHTASGNGSPANITLNSPSNLSRDDPKLSVASASAAAGLHIHTLPAVCAPVFTDAQPQQHDQQPLALQADSSALAAALASPGRSCESLREWVTPLCRGSLAATQALQVYVHSHLDTATEQTLNSSSATCAQKLACRCKEDVFGRHSRTTRVALTCPCDSLAGWPVAAPAVLHWRSRNVRVRLLLVRLFTPRRDTHQMTC